MQLKGNVISQGKVQNCTNKRNRSSSKATEEIHRLQITMQNIHVIPEMCKFSHCYTTTPEVVVCLPSNQSPYFIQEKRYRQLLKEGDHRERNNVIQMVH